MAGCRVKSLYYHCKEDTWTPIESALIKLVRDNPPLYTRGSRGNTSTKLKVSLIWSDIGDQLGLPDCRCREIWKRIVAEWAIVRRLNSLGFPVRHFPRANKFMNTSFSFLETYVDDIKDSEIPHNIYDIYRKKFSINGSIMRANYSYAAGPSRTGNTSTLASSSSDTAKSEVAGAASASADETAVASGTTSKSSSRGTTAVAGTSRTSKQTNVPAKSNASAKSGASDKTDKPETSLSQKSQTHSKSGSNSKSGSHTKADCQKSKSGPSRKSKHK